MLDVMAGPDRADPANVWAAARDFGRLLDGGVRGLRVGFVRHFHEVDMPGHPEVTAALEDVARVLQAEGAEVRTITLPSLNEFAAINRVILCSEAWSIHAPWLRSRPGDYGQLARRRLMPGAFMAAGDYVGAQRRRLQVIAAVEDALRDVDVLLCASSMDPASKIEDAAETQRTYPRQARTPFNVTGHPALAIMSGLASTGLPVSAQFVGRYFDDATVLRVAAAYERATQWHMRRPPIG
jgi:aspartyl-tRNA(Asn)/glutamyl-tRNA(Gln) amidotransferase subunit A